MLSVLGGGALGMFLFAVSTGKEQVHTLHPIFQIGATPVRGELDGEDYNSKMLKDKMINAGIGGGGGEDKLDLERMQQRRITRRQTITDSFQKTGLSDSHGGHWYKEEDDSQKEDLNLQQMLQSRMTRRQTMTDSFQKSGLSDSHGGHWSK